MATWGNLTLKYTGYTESFDRTSGTVKGVYSVPWAIRSDAFGLFGQAHSDYAWLKCSKIEIKPHGVDPINTGPTLALIGATFDTTDQTITSDISEWKKTIEFGGEALTLSQGYWKWEDTSDIVRNTNLTRIIPNATMTYTGTREVADEHYYEEAIGKLNSDTWDGYYPEQLILLGVTKETVYQTGSSGDEASTMTFTMGLRFVGWNLFWHEQATGGNWSVVFAADDSTKRPYELVGFAGAIGPNT